MSATDYLDACGFVPTAGGTTDFIVSTNVAGYQTPASANATNAATYFYRAESADKSQWEIGYGAYTVASTTLARTTVLASSTGAKVNFTVAPNVFISGGKSDITNASLLTSGTVADARLSTNVPLKNAANTFTAAQTISGALGAALTLAGSGGTGGDLVVHRGNTAGAIMLGNTGASYIYFDGTNYFTGGSGNLQIGSGSSAVVAKNTGKAWARWNGTNGTVISSYNVSSVTRNSTGLYTMNLTSALADTNYGSAGMARASSSYNGFVETNYNTTITTTAFQCVTITNDGAGVAVFDAVDVSVILFGN